MATGRVSPRGCYRRYRPRETIRDEWGNTMAGYEYWDEYGGGITEDDARAVYDDMLDEVHGDFMGFSASTVLSECDPIAYREGFHDFADSMLSDGEWFEHDPTADDESGDDD